VIVRESILEQSVHTWSELQHLNIPSFKMRFSVSLIYYEQTETTILEITYTLKYKLKKLYFHTFTEK